MTIDGWTAPAALTYARIRRVECASVGESPLRYVHGWRLAVASNLLRKSNLRIGNIGCHVGYDSGAAFSRAFKTLCGLSPRQARSTPAQSSIARSLESGRPRKG